jgi:hypothetical protein
MPSSIYSQSLSNLGILLNSTWFFLTFQKGPDKPSLYIITEFLIFPAVPRNPFLLHISYIWKDENWKIKFFIWHCTHPTENWVSYNNVCTCILWYYMYCMVLHVLHGITCITLRRPQINNMPSKNHVIVLFTLFTLCNCNYHREPKLCLKINKIKLITSVYLSLSVI